jgi:putative SOS response-associated peptidase YedK
LAVCNEFAQERAFRAYCELMEREALDICSDEPPTLPFGSVHPSEPAVIISAAPGGSVLELIEWGWPPRHGNGLIINVRSEGRRDPPAARGIAPVNRFYEFADGKAPKPKFEFAPAGNEPIGFAVVKRGHRFALLTTEPGPDICILDKAHKRQPVVLRAGGWRRYLTDPEWPRDLMEPSPQGTLRAVQVR